MTTLPDFLFDSHKRYKADTNRIAAWLAETAQKHGHTLEAQPSTSSPSGPRLKGKARKQAREAQKAATGAGTTSAVARYTITVKEFTDLALWIVNQKPPIKVPQIILWLIRSAITLRKRCAEWFQKKMTRENLADESASNLKHSHFIDVLEHVLHILEPNSTPETVDSAQVGRTPSEDTAGKMDAGAKSQAELDNLVNCFDILNIEQNAFAPDAVPEPSAAARNVVSGETTPRAPRNVTYEMEATDEELYFALYCFFDDLDRLRGFLHKLWSQYKAGEIDLITASVTTNMAINLVHRAEQDLTAAFPIIPKTYDGIALVFYILMCGLRGEDPDEREQPDDIVNFAMLDVADWVYLPVYSLLLSFCDVIRSNHAPVMKPGHFGIYNPRVDRSKLTIRQKMQEDRIILFEALPEFFVMANITGGVPVADEFAIGLRSVFVQKTVPLWVAYAAQIFLDINHTLRADVVRGLSELRASGTQAAATLKDYFDTKKPRNFINWPSQNEAAVRGIDQLINRWIVGDAFDLHKRKMYRSMALPTPQPYTLFSRHPLLCGLLQFRLYMLLQEAGITLATAWGTILYVAHLYEGCRQGGYLEKIWPDMELIMDIHTRERIFSGRVPQTPEESLKCMILMLGASPVNFARANRGDYLKPSKKGPKGLGSNSPVSEVFRTRYFETGDATLTFDTVEGLLNEKKLVSTSPVDTNETSEQSLLRRQWAKSHKMTPLQLLDTLRHAIAVEEHMLRFDYFSLHLRCLRLLHTLRELLDQKLQQYFGPNYIENETQLPFLVSYIFEVAAGSGKIGKVLKVKDGSESLMVKRASEVVHEFIGREGAVECDKLEKACVYWNKARRAQVENERKQEAF